MRNHENDNLGEFSDFYEFILYMIFKNFHKKVIIGMAIFGKSRKSYVGWIIKNRECVIIIFAQKWQFGLENQNFEISWNSV